MSGNGDGKILWGWGQGGLGKVNIGGMGQNDEGADGENLFYYTPCLGRNCAFLFLSELRFFLRLDVCLVDIYKIFCFSAYMFELANK